MYKTFYQKHKDSFDKLNGLFTANPVLERGLVLAPVVVATTTLTNGLILGLSFMIITFFTVFIASFISRKFPYTIRVIMYALLASLIFIPTSMLMVRIFGDTVFKLGIFMPLLIANSLIVVKSESKFHKTKRSIMILDLICNTLGFLMVIVLVGFVRELIGYGSIAGIKMFENFKVASILLPFSGFIIVGFLAAIVQKIKLKLLEPKKNKLV